MMHYGFVEVFWMLQNLVFTVAPTVLLVIAVVWLRDIGKSLRSIAVSLKSREGGAPANMDRGED